MDFSIAEPPTDSLAKLTGEELKVRQDNRL